jgi:glycosyltransferase involved in cell wall biosynthesis/peptidoglycan/xylan/chitin deacetylase (PgdA/CDA1 family)
MNNFAEENSGIKFSVVIATFNRQDILSRSLPTVINQDFPADQYEIVIVLDGCTDETAKQLSELRPACALRIIEQANRGQAVARNQGIKTAKGEIILLLDDDLLCDSGLLQQHAAAHDSNPGCLLIGRTRLSRDCRKTAASEFRRRYNDLHHPAAVVNRDWPEYGICANASLSLKRSIFLELGGFEETFSRAFEDIEFGLRLHISGIKFQYLPGALTEEIYEKSSEEVVTSAEAWDGEAELLLCNMQPGYRPHSTFSSSSLWKWPNSWMWLSLVSLAPILKLPLSIASRLLELLIGVRFFCNAAVRLFGMRLRLAALRAAVEKSGSWRNLRNQFGRSLPVLLYHHVGPRVSGTLPSLTISPEKFAAQVGWLRQHKYQPITPRQWLHWCRTGKDLPDNAVLLTFDDAYSDLCEYALPVLRRHGFSAEVFVVTGLIGTTDQWNRDLSTSSYELMTEQQIRYWHSSGVAFGAHSRTHSDLRVLSSVAVMDEVAGSGDDLREISGARPRSFAFPYGNFDEQSMKAVRTNYEMAFTVEEGLNTLATDLHSLRRTMVQPRETLFEFGLRVRFGRNPLLPLRRALSSIKKFLLGRRS